MGTTATTRVEIEHAVNIVRAVLTLLGATTVLTAGIGTGSSAREAGVVAVGLGLFAAMVVTGSRRITGRSALTTRWLVLLHLMDVVLFIALAGALETYVDDASWALFAIPIVLAALRFDDRSVAVTWLLGAAGYGLATVTGLWAGAPDAQKLAGRLGILLAVAAGIALMARWLQDAWQHQAELTAAAELRSDRLATIESGVRAMRTGGREQIIATCVGAVPDLGFDSGTATMEGTILAAAGVEQPIPDDGDQHGMGPDEIHVTRWRSPDSAGLHSASVVEPFTGATITGWRSSPIDAATATALHDLVSNLTTALEAAHHLERIRYRATHDPLTDLANRAMFHHHLSQLTARPGPLTVLFIDLDNFKPINDTHGHQAGDKVLVAVARRLHRAVGDHGLVARLGGDEFAILLPGLAAHHTEALCGDLGQILSQPVAFDGHQLTTSASIGAATAQGPVDAGTLLAQADAAAYAAKASGRNTFSTATIPTLATRSATG